MFKETQPSQAQSSAGAPFSFIHKGGTIVRTDEKPSGVFDQKFTGSGLPEILTAIGLQSYTKQVYVTEEGDRQGQTLKLATLYQHHGGWLTVEIRNGYEVCRQCEPVPACLVTANATSTFEVWVAQATVPLDEALVSVQLILKTLLANIGLAVENVLDHPSTGE